MIFYLYPSDFTAGNTTDMTATMVTAASGTDVQTNTGGQTSATPAPTAAAEVTPTPEATETPTPTPEATEEATATPTPGVQSNSLQNSITEAAAPAADSAGEDTLNDAQGLSLSTEGEAASAETGRRGRGIGSADRGADDCDYPFRADPAGGRIRRSVPVPEKLEEMGRRL